ncbi:split-Soret cytochrome c [Desulfosudis oleivorans]|uniref:Split soret cytochrome c n=1 Tax=Desulfosudis oleivorans (strain DSM 6200 / JCM 39069 / Hxd3) TaxID=96561 RepID=A8ZZ47_DESOH|nr:C-GCAxxG-C-C family protein [Desulfosudis oleivorans]ABW68820.1 split soret cytochrome c precursor [Desulfosudis oleivorans Hxd3]
MQMSRREVLGTISGVLVGSALTGVNMAFSREAAVQDGYWVPHKLDAEQAAAFAYENHFYKGYGCCYGAFQGIVGMMARKYGAPYDTFPMHMMEVGKSGISEWGTICGALLGAVSAWALFWGRADRDPMVDELFTWYELASLPGYKPKKGLAFDGDLPASVPASVLCHPSVSKWCYEHGIDMNSKQRSERCARVTGTVTHRAVAIMNAKIDKAGFAVLGPGASRTACGACHSPDGESDILKGKMECKACHSGALADVFNDHP